MSKYNPFHNLIETNRYPHARFYRTTFWRKMADTFKVFYGSFSFKETPDWNVGIFDYLTLGLHYLINIPILYMAQSRSDVFKILSLVLYLIWNIPRILFAGILTLLCTPFVLVAQLLSRDTGDALKNDIFSYNIKNAEYQIHTHPSVLPSNYSDSYYINSFIFINQSNQLYFIDINGDAHNIAIKDTQGFRSEFNVNNNLLLQIGFPSSHFYDKEVIDRYLTNPPELQNQTFGEFLEAKELELEDIKYSKIILNPENDQKFLLGLGKVTMISSLTKEKPVLQVLPINLKNNFDLTFFNQLRKLNVAQIETNIENDTVLQQKFGQGGSL